MYVIASQLLRVFVCYCTSLYVSVSHCQSQRVIQPLCILSGFVSLYMCVWASVCMFQLFRMYVIVSQLLRVLVCYCTSLYVSVSQYQSQRAIQLLCILSGFVSLYMCVWASVCMFQLFRMYVIVSQLLRVFCVLLYISVRVCEPLSISACHSAPVYLEWLCKSLYVCLGVCMYVSAI